jgi:sec-independent protein translocase protein TatC
VKSFFARRQKSQIAADTSLTLIEHLDELRARIIRAVIYLLCGLTLAWVFYDRISGFLLAPIVQVIGAKGNIQVIDLFEAFWVRCQVSLVAGLALTLPLLLLEIWGFVRPALTPRERHTIRLMPLVVALLFILGTAFGYWMSHLFVAWMLSSYFIKPWMAVQLRLNGALLIMAKTLLAFGLGFQLPILIVLLNRLGVLPGEVLVRRWREATMAVFVIAAIVTPTWDPISMFLAALPLALLYAGTVGVIRLLEERERRATAAGAAQEEPPQDQSG